MRALLLSVGVLVVAVAPTASAAVCVRDAKPRLTRAERDLRDAISGRKSFDLPHGRAFVRRVNADPAARRRGDRLLRFPVAACEAPYFRDRFRFQDPRFTRRLNRYLARQGATIGEVSIEDDYPRGAYLLVHFTRDLDRQRREIARRFDLRFVVRRAEHTRRELRAV